MEKLRELEAKVIDWANDRNFFGEGGATLFGQYLKLREEFGELSGNFAKGRCMKDDIGDVTVVAIIMNKLSDGNPFIHHLERLETIQMYDEYKSLEYDERYLVLDHQIFNIGVSESNVDCIKNIILTISTLMYFAKLNNYNFTECLEYAYEEIKDRKGEWRNNTFVKESDL